MSTGTRLAPQYRQYATDQLRSIVPAIRNARRLAAVKIVLTEREDAYQAAFDATQVVLDAIGGTDAPDLHARAVAAMMREAEAGRWLECSRASGVADALWDYIRERSDT